MDERNGRPRLWANGGDGGRRSPSSTRSTGRGGRMFQRIIDDVKLSVGTGVRQTSLAAMAAVALFITTCFLCAAAFVAVLERYGLIEACLAGAGLFFVVTLIAAGTYLVRKRRIERQVKERGQSAG